VFFNKDVMRPAELLVAEVIQMDKLLILEQYVTHKLVVLPLQLGLILEYVVSVVVAVFFNKDVMRPAELLVAEVIQMDKLLILEQYVTHKLVVLPGVQPQQTLIVVRQIRPIMDALGIVMFRGLNV